MSDKNIQKMQEMIAHQAQEIADLNAVVTQQWEEIDALKTAVRKILDKVSVIEDSGDGSGQVVVDKPPHY